MSVDVQRGAAGHMADDRGKGLHIHAVLQGGSGEGMPQIVEPKSLAVSPFQYGGQPLPDSGGVHRGIFFLGRGEHSPGGAGVSIGFEYNSGQETGGVPCVALLWFWVGRLPIHPVPNGPAAPLGAPLF